MISRGWRHVAVGAGLVLVSVVPSPALAAGKAATGKVAAVKAAPGRAAKAPVEHRVLPFISDDYARAVDEARARQVPIFVEAWAPW